MDTATLTHAIDQKGGITLVTEDGTITTTLTREERDARDNEMQDLRRQGLTNVQIAEQMGVTRQRVHQVLGPVRPAPAEDKITVVGTKKGIERLRELAVQHGYRTTSGPKAGQGSVSLLLGAVARGELEIRRRK